MKTTMMNNATVNNVDFWALRGYKKAVKPIYLSDLLNDARNMPGTRHTLDGEFDEGFVREFGQHTGFTYAGKGQWVSEWDANVRTWQFQVLDNQAGIETIEEAFSQYDIDYIEFNAYERRRFTEPDAEIPPILVGADYTLEDVIVAPEKVAYCAVWGGVREALEDDECYSPLRYGVEACNLTTGLNDGGVILRSATSGAFIAAVKKGGIWTLTLSMCEVQVGAGRDATRKLTGFTYHKHFKEAWKYWLRKRSA